MGRLSEYAKEQILKLRFQKHQKITQIVKTLTKEHIKISRQSVSTFLKKYLETDSINDKPRSGRKRKLTQDEIKLIGELTKQNPEITARAIKECLNLNVSTYTILRATKLFEWNKINPNSNEAKKAAALERELSGGKKRKKYPKAKKKTASNDDQNIIELKNQGIDILKIMNCETDDSHNLYLLTEQEILHMKNLSSSAMIFAARIMFKLFQEDELKGHYVCGRALSKNFKNKKPIIDKRILYIKWLIENYYKNSENKEELWQQCRKSMNKHILNFERKGKKMVSNDDYEAVLMSKYRIKTIKSNDLSQINPNNLRKTNKNTENDESTEQESDDSEESEDDDEDEDEEESDEDDEDDYECEQSENENESSVNTSLVCDELESINTRKSIFDCNNVVNNENTNKMTTTSENIDINLLDDNELTKLRMSTCSPMAFATKLLLSLFTIDELKGNCVSGKALVCLDNETNNKNRKKTNENRQSLDDKRIVYIKSLVEKYFKIEDERKCNVWKSCCRALNQRIRFCEIKKEAFDRKADSSYS